MLVRLAVRAGARVRIVLVALVAAALAALGVVTAAQPAAHADTAPQAPKTPTTVSADALPTVQVDGVVWSQVVVGNTAYATGSFTHAWPAGTAEGAASTVTVGSLIAYDVTTGNMITSFSHLLNGQGLAVAASPDGSRVYVGGDFTTVDGVAHDHIAAFDTATGTLVSGFTADISSTVNAITATNSVVYAGGAFFNVNGHSRSRVAALTASSGALLSWYPTIDDNNVTAMLISPDQTKVIIAGHFTSANSQPAYGIVSVDPVTGATLPWNANFPVQDAGNAAAITSLTTDGTNLYGSGYVFGAGGNMEGRFASDFNGNIIWIDSCHGDTYSTFETGQVIYSVGHAHDCSDLGLWDDSSPRQFRRALASTIYPTGTLLHNDNGAYYDFYGYPDSTQLYWYPSLAIGSFTGQNQAAWSVAGNSQYIVLGGEFPTVNGVAQSGLVRFAVPSIAPNKTAPVGMASMTPVARSLSPGTARISWTGTYDYDNQHLTYALYRDGGSTPIYTATNDNPWWQLAQFGYTDTGLTPGSTHTYQVKAWDPFNNRRPSAVSAPVTIMSTAVPSAYVNDLTSDGATNLWRLSEPSGPVGFDTIGNADLAENTGVTEGAAGPITGDSSAAATFSGSSAGAAVSGSPAASTQRLSLEAWVLTTSKSGGQIVGMGSQWPVTSTSPITSSANHDRQLYLDNSGHFNFTVNANGTLHSIRSPGVYNDGKYHHVVATLGDSGMFLYADGQVVARDQTITTSTPFTGYWHVGGDNVGGLPNKPSSGFLAGRLADVAVYPSALTLGQVQQHYLDAGRSLSIPPAPTDAYGAAAVYQDNPEFYWRLNDARPTTAADSGRENVTGIYTGSGVTTGQPGAFSGSGTAATFDGRIGNVASTISFANPEIYSEELWFKTTTTKGGKLIGFGSSQTGTSSKYDRHIYMINSGQLVFGAYSGAQVTITSAKSYNDGAWHYLAATQGTNGMQLWVDGVLVGSNPNTIAQNYTGYWRVGGDAVWSGASSGYFAGTIDEVAVYPQQLSGARIVAHYDAAGGDVPPVPAFTPTCTYLSCQFDSSASSDPDGSIAAYAWTFGDGGTSTTASPAHAYAAPGTYTVTLTATDNKGVSSSTSQTVTVTSAPAPAAQFTANCPGLVCGFDGTGSSSPVGIATYSWTFGDGATSTAAQPTHRYASPGSYIVTLTVTDTQGGASSSTQTVSITDLSPQAAFTSSCQVVSCSFDASGSNDPDGTIASYAWDFGDGVTGSGVNPTHTYANPGTYNVTLTVTDDQGASTMLTQAVTAVNQPPSAAFIANCTALSCSFDSSASNDPDGTIVSYAWTFSDGATSTSASPTHAFAAAGDYPVTLTVTDNLGATNSVQQTITVRPPANPNTAPYATDAFGRTVSIGWGTADSGGSWLASGNSANMAVTNGTATLAMTKAGAQPGGYLDGVSSTDTDVTTAFSLREVGNGGGTTLYTTGRRVALNSEYRGVVHVLSTGVVNVGIAKLDGSASNVVLMPERAVSGLTYKAGSVLDVRLDVTGTSPTTVRMRVWADGTPEPITWQVSTTDSSPALQASGTVGLSTYLSGTATNFPVTASFYRFRAEPTNTPPSAAFGVNCTSLTCSVDASASTDTQNNIASYAWSYGDGTTSAGVTDSHSYATAGTYRITLTVTDTTGLTSVATQTVTVG